LEIDIRHDNTIKLDDKYEFLGHTIPE